MESDANFWKSIIGNIPSWIALAISICAFSLSIKNYRISLRKEERIAADIHLYLKDSYFIDPDEKKEFHANLMIVNRSESQNSICEIELIIYIVLADGTEVKRRIRPKESSIVGNLSNLPIKIGPGEAISGLISFDVPNVESDFNRKLSIVTLEAIDSSGIAFSIDSTTTSVRKL